MKKKKRAKGEIYDELSVKWNENDVIWGYVYSAI